MIYVKTFEIFQDGCVNIVDLRLNEETCEGKIKVSWTERDGQSLMTNIFEYDSRETRRQQMSALFGFAHTCVFPFADM